MLTSDIVCGIMNRMPESSNSGNPTSMHPGAARAIEEGKMSVKPSVAGFNPKFDTGKTTFQLQRDGEEAAAQVAQMFAPTIAADGTFIPAWGLEHIPFTPPTIGEIVTKPISDLIEKYNKPGHVVEGTSERALASLSRMAETLGLDSEHWREYPLFRDLVKYIDASASSAVPGENVLLNALRGLSLYKDGQHTTETQGPLEDGHTLQVRRFTYYLHGEGKLPDSGNVPNEPSDSTKAIETFQIEHLPVGRVTLMVKDRIIDDGGAKVQALFDESHRVYGYYDMIRNRPHPLARSQQVEDRHSIGHDYNLVSWRRETPRPVAEPPQPKKIFRIPVPWAKGR